MVSVKEIVVAVGRFAAQFNEFEQVVVLINFLQIVKSVFVNGAVYYSNTFIAGSHNIHINQEADITQRDEIEASLDLIQACPTITMVLNKQQISSRYTFGAYSSYYSS